MIRQSSTTDNGIGCGCIGCLLVVTFLILAWVGIILGLKAIF